MNNHKGKRLFITGIPTSGKSYLAKKLAERVGGIAVLLDGVRENLAQDERYRKWTQLYFDRDEYEYLVHTSPDEQWQNLVAQSEGLWTGFLREIEKYKDEEKPVIFECVNLLPNITRKYLSFDGIVLLGKSYEQILERNKLNPRWGKTEVLQELESKYFFEVERPHYKEEAEKYRYKTFETADEAFNTALEMLEVEN